MNRIVSSLSLSVLVAAASILPVAQANAASAIWTTPECATMIHDYDDFLAQLDDHRDNAEGICWGTGWATFFITCAIFVQVDQADAYSHGFRGTVWNFAYYGGDANMVDYGFAGVEGTLAKASEAGMVLPDDWSDLYWTLVDAHNDLGACAASRR